MSDINKSQIKINNTDIKNISNNNKGAVYITVVMILSILLILLGFLLNISSFDTRKSREYADGIIAYYLAQSGSAQAMAYIMENKEQSFTMGEALQNVHTPPYNDQNSIQWSVSYNEIENTYTIISTGIYKNRYKKTIKILITLDSNDRITINQLRLVYD